MNNSTTILPKKDLKVKTPELTEDEKRSISKEIETIVREYASPKLTWQIEAALRADVDGYLVAGDGKVMFTDYPSFEKFLKEIFTGIRNFIEADITSLHVYVLSREAAACTFELKSKYLTTEGETVIHNACWTFVFKKFDVGWKVVHENGTHTHQ